MTHPGLVDDQLQTLCGARAKLRFAELEAVSGPDLRATVESLGIKLVSFAALKPVGSSRR
jgi:predicted glycoside hydrolase/deacetylase ChbG (UPF0249 family)